MFCFGERFKVDIYHYGAGILHYACEDISYKIISVQSQKLIEGI